jgi:hypothetical protein
MAEIRQIVQDYVLITFDIPQNQGKLRKLVLKKIHSIGGMMHTASVYLIPYSDKAMELANMIKEVGDVVVWTSHQDNLSTAKNITFSYDNHLAVRCSLISQRFYKIQQYIDKEQLGRANTMILKTKVLIDQLHKISETYCPSWLPEKLKEFDNQLSQVIGGNK